jgi:hypothetical protein
MYVATSGVPTAVASSQDDQSHDLVPDPIKIVSWNDGHDNGGLEPGDSDSMLHYVPFNSAEEGEVIEGDGYEYDDFDVPQSANQEESLLNALSTVGTAQQSVMATVTNLDNAGSPGSELNDECSDAADSEIEAGSYADGCGPEEEYSGNFDVEIEQESYRESPYTVDPIPLILTLPEVIRSLFHVLYADALCSVVGQQGIVIAARSGKRLRSAPSNTVNSCGFAFALEPDQDYKYDEDCEIDDQTEYMSNELSFGDEGETDAMEEFTVGEGGGEGGSQALLSRSMSEEEVSDDVNECLSDGGIAGTDEQEDEVVEDITDAALILDGIIEGQLHAHDKTKEAYVYSEESTVHTADVSTPSTACLTTDLDTATSELEANHEEEHNVYEDDFMTEGTLDASTQEAPVVSGGVEGSDESLTVSTQPYGYFDNSCADDHILKIQLVELAECVSSIAVADAVTKTAAPTNVTNLIRASLALEQNAARAYVENLLAGSALTGPLETSSNPRHILSGSLDVAVTLVNEKTGIGQDASFLCELNMTTETDSAFSTELAVGGSVCEATLASSDSLRTSASYTVSENNSGVSEVLSPDNHPVEYGDVRLGAEEIVAVDGPLEQQVAAVSDRAPTETKNATDGVISTVTDSVPCHYQVAPLEEPVANIGSSGEIRERLLNIENRQAEMMTLLVQFLQHSNHGKTGIVIMTSLPPVDDQAMNDDYAVNDDQADQAVSDDKAPVDAEGVRAGDSAEVTTGVLSNLQSFQPGVVAGLVPGPREFSANAGDVVVHPTSPASDMQEHVSLLADVCLANALIRTEVILFTRQMLAKSLEEASKGWSSRKRVNSPLPLLRINADKGNHNNLSNSSVPSEIIEFHGLSSNDTIVASKLAAGMSPVSSALELIPDRGHPAADCLERTPLSRLDDICSQMVLTFVDNVLSTAVLSYPCARIAGKVPQSQSQVDSANEPEKPECRAQHTYSRLLPSVNVAFSIDLLKRRIRSSVCGTSNQYGLDSNACQPFRSKISAVTFGSRVRFPAVRGLVEQISEGEECFDGPGLVRGLNDPSVTNAVFISEAVRIGRSNSDAEAVTAIALASQPSNSEVSYPRQQESGELFYTAELDTFSWSDDGSEHLGAGSLNSSITASIDKLHDIFASSGFIDTAVTAIKVSPGALKRKDGKFASASALRNDERQVTHPKTKFLITNSDKRPAHSTDRLVARPPSYSVRPTLGPSPRSSAVTISEKIADYCELMRKRDSRRAEPPKQKVPALENDTSYFDNTSPETTELSIDASTLIDLDKIQYASEKSDDSFKTPKRPTASRSSSLPRTYSFENIRRITQPPLQGAFVKEAAVQIQMPQYSEQPEFAAVADQLLLKLSNILLQKLEGMKSDGSVKVDAGNIRRNKRQIPGSRYNYPQPDERTMRVNKAKHADDMRKNRFRQPTQDIFI